MSMLCAFQNHWMLIFQADFKKIYYYLCHKNEKSNTFLYFNQKWMYLYVSLFQKGSEAAQKGKYHTILGRENSMIKGMKASWPLSSLSSSVI